MTERYYPTAPRTSQECYERHEETPTITLITAAKAVTLPYHQLREMVYGTEALEILLRFDSHEARIAGVNLHPLWRELQLYQVRVIEAKARLELGEMRQGCQVINVEIKELD